jgi:predicted regulator of Ras-like GTPase activity (Roadblock/LC7/MglB family)
MKQPKRHWPLFLLFKPGAPQPVASSTTGHGTPSCLYGLWPQIQATCCASGRRLQQERGRLLSYTLDQKQLDRFDDILQKDLIDNGVRCVFLIDMAGNIITNLDNGEKQHDIYSLAALAAGNFGAVSAMAKIIGESEFSLLFHKGKKENIHFNKITTEFLLITIFGNDISLGFLRLKVSESVEQLKVLLEHDALKLSVGQKQRIALIRAMMLEPEVLLLDEPGSALDSSNRKLIEHKIESLINSSGITVLMATHSAVSFEGTDYRVFALEDRRLTCHLK